MIYGSVKNDFNIAGYISKRIELIFDGVLIFSVVELLQFPRSSRKMVEETSFHFFLTMNDFLNQAVKGTKYMETYVSVLGKSSSSDFSTGILFRKNEDPFQLEKLAACHSKLRSQSSKLKKELDASLEEPHVELSMPLEPEPFRGTVCQQSYSKIQAFLLIDSLKKLASFYQQKYHPSHDFGWQHLHTEILQNSAEALDNICKWLKSAYPDGRLRPQDGNSLKAVTAAASFRSIEDVRLRSISKWSDNFQRYLAMRGFEESDPEATMIIGITTGCLLELCRHMQKAGRHMEEIVYHFPST